MTNFKNMTLRQFQAIVKIQTGSLDELDKETEILAILTGKTARQLDEMLLQDYKALAAKAAKALKDIKELPMKPQMYIGPFAIEYDVSRLTYGQWVTIMHFAKGNPIENAHLVLASIVKPVKKYWLFRWAGKHNPDHHAEYAELILDLPIIPVYHSCLFFCKLYRSSLDAIRDFLANQAAATGKVTVKEALSRIADSIKIMDGFIAQNELQTLTE